MTPPIDAGLLPGITREFLFEVGKEEGSRCGKRSSATKICSPRMKRS